MMGGISTVYKELKMKKLVCFLKTFTGAVISAGFIALIFAGCVSKPAETENITENTEKSTKQQTKQKKEPEIKDTPEVAFAKSLQKELNNNDIQGAINLFTTMPEELKDDSELQMLLASLYISAGELENSKRVAEQILQTQPENLEALELTSIIARASGDTKSYHEISSKILEVDPTNPSVNIQQAEDFVLGKKYKQARKSYQQALKAEPQNQDALFGYGQMSFYLDDLKESRKTFEKILTINPENAAAYAYLGKLEAENQNYGKAFEYIQKAVKLEPNNYDYLMDLGSYQRFLGRYDDAAESWKKAVSIDPNYFLAYAYLAGSYDEQDKTEEALENYHMVIKTNPQYFYAYESTAILEWHMEHWENARKFFEKAYSYNQSSSYALMIAATYLKQKDAFNAKKFLEKAMKTMDKTTLEYEMVRFYHDNYTRTSETNIKNKISKETNSTIRGKLLFYMGLYYELNGSMELANDFYAKVTAMRAPLFFEYRIAEWGLKL